MQEIILRSEIRPGDIGHIIRRHRDLYETEFGFSSEFGDYVEESFRESSPVIWIAEANGKFAGCIGLVETSSDLAQLRWFLVEPETRGMGIGKMIFTSAVDYCRKKNYRNIFLWTVNKLPVARKIYEEFGFHLTETKPEMLLWGQYLSEQRWDLSLDTNR